MTRRGAETPMIWTVGHSTRTAEEFVGLLGAWRIDWLIDVRTVPRSRRNPQFETQALAGTLAAASIAYRHEPRLGGLRRPRPDSINTAWRNSGFRGYADHMQTPQFEQALDELIAMAAGHRLALMCAEAVPWRCHRSLLSDALAAREVAVEHILSATKTQPHGLTPFARVAGSQVTYPGLV